jgi:hypothetical protein
MVEAVAPKSISLQYNLLYQVLKCSIDLLKVVGAVLAIPPEPRIFMSFLGSASQQKKWVMRSSFIFSERRPFIIAFATTHCESDVKPYECLSSNGQLITCKILQTTHSSG